MPFSSTGAAPPGAARKAGACAALLLLACGACGDRAAPPPELWSRADGEAVERRLLAAAWDTLWRVGGERDTLLLNPLLVRASRERVYVFDHPAQRLLAFDPRGGLQWAVGRKGAGPDEFGEVRGLEAVEGDTAFLLDVANQRVTAVDGQGRIVRRVPLHAAFGRGAAFEFVPLSRGRFLLSTTRQDSSLVVVDSAGRVLARTAVPWDGYRRLNPLQRQARTAVAPDRERWVMGFRLGDGWFRFAGGRALDPPGSYAEHQPFPRIRRERQGLTRVYTGLVGFRPCTGCGVAVDDSVVSFLFGGYSDGHRALVDRFRWSDAAYLGSLRLPVRAKAMALAGGVYYVLYEDPYPTLIALRPRLAPDGARRERGAALSAAAARVSPRNAASD